MTPEEMSEDFITTKKQYQVDLQAAYDCGYAQALRVITDIRAELWDSGMNMGGEYQGVWVRFRDIEKAFDKYTAETAPTVIEREEIK